jgi:uncharacterized protein (DUF2147 family)
MRHWPKLAFKTFLKMCKKIEIKNMAFSHIPKALLATAVIASNGVFIGEVHAQSTPVGLWRNVDDKTGESKAEIRIAANAQGVLTGNIEKALGKSANPAEPNCNLCTDDRKDKPKLGLQIIRNAQKVADKDQWEGGTILDPENGKTYPLRLTPIEEGNKLEVRGSIGPFWRTQTWVRVK